MIRGMRTRVLAYVAIVWGGAVVGYGLTKGLDGNGSYAAGSIAAFALGCVLFVGGAWTVVRR